MDFAKKRSDYIVQYTKREALKLLKQEDRVKNAHISTTGMLIINTIPVEIKGYGYDEIALGIIGSYSIRISNYNGRLNITIKRKEGSCCGDWHHPHIKTTWSSSICWGSAEDEIYTICKQKDWFWAAKRCLDLLWDCFLEESEVFYNQIERLQEFQSSINPKLKKKLYEGEIKLKTRIRNEILKKEKLKIKIGDTIKFKKSFKGIVKDISLDYNDKRIRFIVIIIKKNLTSYYEKFLDDYWHIFPRNFKYMKKVIK